MKVVAIPLVKKGFIPISEENNPVRWYLAHFKSDGSDGALASVNSFLTRQAAEEHAEKTGFEVVNPDGDSMETFCADTARLERISASLKEMRGDLDVLESHYLRMELKKSVGDINERLLKILAYRVQVMD